MSFVLLNKKIKLLISIFIGSTKNKISKSMVNIAIGVNT